MNDLSIFYESGQIGVTKILIAYFDRHVNLIDEFISTMHSEFMNEYGHDMTNKVFGSTSPTQVLRSEPKSKWNFFRNITGNKNQIHRLSTNQ